MMNGMAAIVVLALAAAIGAVSASAEFRCYSCTSYMSQCKQKVDDSQGDVFKTNCRSKCFVRQGEEGAIYRGCFDGFEEVMDLTSAYTGCRNQTWNRQSLRWCLCDTDLCNVDAQDVVEDIGRKSPYAYSYDFSNSVHYNSVDDYGRQDKKPAKKESKYEEKPGMGSFAKEASEDKMYDETLFGFDQDVTYNSAQKKKAAQSAPAQNAYRTAVNYEQNYYRQEPRGYDYVYYGIPDGQQPAAGSYDTKAGRQAQAVDSSAKQNNAAGYDTKQNGAKGLYYDYDYYSPEGYARDAFYQYNYGQFAGRDNLYPKSGSQYNSAAYGENSYYSRFPERTYNYVSPKLATKIKCAQTGYYQNPSDCRQFVACLIDHHTQTPVMHVMKCPDGLVWDNLKKICMEFSTTCNVAGSFAGYDDTMYDDSGTYRLNVDGYQSNMEYYPVADVSSVFKDVVYSDDSFVQSNDKMSNNVKLNDEAKEVKEDA